MEKTEKAIFTNMCMVISKDMVLIQHRTDPRWSGVAFPGGHVEPGEVFYDSVVREVWEESGLTILDPVLCGVRQFERDGARYVVLLYIATKFTGELHDSEEGKMEWVKRDTLRQLPLARYFEYTLQVFEDSQKSECVGKKVDGEWQTYVY